MPHDDVIGRDADVLTNEHIASYRHNGFLVLPGHLPMEDVRAVRASITTVLEERTERTVMESSGRVVRSVYGIHEHDDLFRHLARDPRMVVPALQLLGGDVYVYQSKLNDKAPFDGDVWDWHQDYTFWFHEDAMPAPRAINVALFLDDVNEFNGPLFFVNGSHRYGMLDCPPLVGNPEGYEAEPQWVSNLTATIKYALDRNTVSRLALEHGLSAPRGPAGTVLLFDSAVVHASPANISPFTRRMVVFTYNRVDNAPPETKRQRPTFLVSSDCRPLKAGGDAPLPLLGMDHA